jgi:hypothetical protein
MSTGCLFILVKSCLANIIPEGEDSKMKTNHYMYLVLLLALALACSPAVPVSPSNRPAATLSLMEVIPAPAVGQTDTKTRDNTFIAKINSYPDYTQTDPAYGGFPGKGSDYCGPVSASNAIMWLSEHGFPNLSPHTGDRKKDQYDVAYALGSAKYMNTGIAGAATGTNPTKFCRGLKQYVLDSGYKYASLEFQGWRDIPAEFDTRASVPDLEWARQGIRGNGCAWLSIGWYTYDRAADEYTRFNSHWVTLVGYGHDGKIPNPEYLIVHNSATSSVSQPNEYILPEPIQSGTFKGNYPGLPCSAKGYTKANGLPWPGRADAGIIEYAIVLQMQP